MLMCQPLLLLFASVAPTALPQMPALRCGASQAFVGDIAWARHSCQPCGRRFGRIPLFSCRNGEVLTSDLASAAPRPCSASIRGAPRRVRQRMQRNGPTSLPQEHALTAEAFGRMFTENHTRVLRYVEGSVYDRDEAEEITAEVFTIAWQKFDDRQPFGLPWLIRTAMHKVRDHQRRHYRKASMLDALTRRAEEAPAELSRLDILALRDALSKLSGTDAEIVRLTYWDGLSAGEVSTVLRVRQGTVWTRLSRARALLKSQLSESEVTSVE